MNKAIILALAPLAMLAVPAAAQTTTHTTMTPQGNATRTVTRTNDVYGNRSTTVQTNRVTPNGTVSRTEVRGPGVREHSVTRTNEHGWNGTRSWSRHGMRHCWTTWRHHHRERTCRTMGNRG